MFWQLHWLLNINALIPPLDFFWWFPTWLTQIPCRRFSQWAKRNTPWKSQSEQSMDLHLHMHHTLKSGTFLSVLCMCKSSLKWFHVLAYSISVTQYLLGFFHPFSCTLCQMHTSNSSRATKLNIYVTYICYIHWRKKYVGTLLFALSSANMLLTAITTSRISHAFLFFRYSYKIIDAKLKKKLLSKVQKYIKCPDLKILSSVLW